MPKYTNKIQYMLKLSLCDDMWRTTNIGYTSSDHDVTGTLMTSLAIKIPVFYKEL